MIVSQSEVRALVRKAAVGAGQPPGVALDLARSAVWLCAHGFDGVVAALAALADDPESRLVSRSGAGGDTWVAADARLALDGRAGLDLLSAGVAPGGVSYESPDAPLVLLGAAAVASGEQGCGFVLSCDGVVSAVLDRGVAQGHIEPDTAEIRVEHRAADRVESDLDPIEPVDEIAIDPEAWQRASELAAKTYVPSTAESRTAGAGAGLTDND